MTIEERVSDEILKAQRVMDASGLESVSRIQLADYLAHVIVAKFTVEEK